VNEPLLPDDLDTRYNQYTVLHKSVAVYHNSGKTRLTLYIFARL